MKFSSKIVEQAGSNQCKQNENFSRNIQLGELLTLFESENERQKIEPVPIPLPRASRNFPDVKTRNGLFFYLIRKRVVLNVFKTCKKGNF